MLIDPDYPHPLEPRRIFDQDTLTFGQDRGFGSIPRHPEAFGDSGDCQVLVHNRFQGPTQTAPRQFGSGLGGSAAVLALYRATTATPVAAHSDQQSCGPPAERLMSQFPCHGVTAGALLAAATAPPVRFGDPARQHSTIGLQALAGHLRPELIKAAESGSVRISKGSVGHVEVFLMGGVRTSIIGRPRPLSRHRRAELLYTLNCEEPVNTVPDLYRRWPSASVVGTNTLD